MKILQMNKKFIIKKWQNNEIMQLKHNNENKYNNVKCDFF